MASYYIPADYVENYDLTANNAIARNNLNAINLPEHNRAILRLEVELRDKNAPKYRRGVAAGRRGGGGGPRNNIRTIPEQAIVAAPGVAVVPMEKVGKNLSIELQSSTVVFEIMNGGRTLPSIVRKRQSS